MDENDNPFRKAGIALFVIGVIDIGVMVYCISNKIGYSSSFNIFAVVAGILLMKGGVKTARALRWLSAFLPIVFISMLLVIPLTTPPDLLLAQIKLNFIPILLPFMFGTAFIAVLVWVYLQLSTPNALSILAQAGYKTDMPKSAFVTGVVVLVLSVGFSIYLLNGDLAIKAKGLARDQLGPNYNYHVSSLSASNESGQASVIAYNDSEIKTIEVHW